MYQPKIKEEAIRSIYRLKRVLGKPMTRILGEKEMNRERFRRRLYFAYRHSFRSGRGIEEFLMYWQLSREVF